MDSMSRAKAQANLEAVEGLDQAFSGIVAGVVDGIHTSPPVLKIRGKRHNGDGWPTKFEDILLIDHLSDGIHFFVWG